MSLLAFIFPSAIFAETYDLPKGGTGTINTTVSYEKVTIGGNLTVNGGATVTTPATVLGGNADESATIAISGKNTVFNSTKVTIGGSAGGTGKISTSDGGVIRIGWTNGEENRLEVAAGAVPASGGAIDVLSLGAGMHTVARMANLSAYPAGILFTDGAQLSLETSASSQWTTSFWSGNWVLESDDSAEIKISCPPSHYFTGSSALVRTAGSGLFHVVRGPTVYDARMTFANTGGFTLDAGVDFKFAAGKVDMSAMRGPMTVNGTLDVKNNSVYADGLVVGSGGLIKTTSTQPFTFGSGDYDGEFSAAVPLSNRVVKVGTGTLSVTGASSAGDVIVSNGTLKVSADLSVTSLTLETGVALVIDGVDFAPAHFAQDPGATVTTINGGRLVQGGGSFVEVLRPAMGGTFRKVGAAQMTIYEPTSLPSSVQVADGELAFSKYGLSQRYWKWTFKGVANGPAPLKSLGKLWLYGADGNRVGEGIAYAEYKANVDLTAKDAYKGKATWICGAHTNVLQHSPYETYFDCFTGLKNLFTYTVNQNNFPNTMSPVIDKDNPDSYLGVEIRFRDDDGPIVGYNIGLSTQTNGGRPTDWTVEASDDGENWTTVDVRSDVTLPSNTYCIFYDGTTYKSKETPDPSPAETFHFTGYVREGLAPASAPISVQVDGNAKLNLSAFAGGQNVNALIYDAEEGAGEIENAVFVANGTLYYTSVSGKPVRGEILPYVLTDCSGLENLATWSVVINGKATAWRVFVQNGQLTLIPPGLIIVVR